MNDLLDPTPHYLMTYGTLRPGFGNNGLIVRNGGKDIGPCQTAGKFLLNEGFPFVWKLPRGLTGAYHQYLGHIVGHLYKVSDVCLEACDRLEGHPRYYCRTNVPVVFNIGARLQYATAGMYLAPGELPMPKSLQTPVAGLLEWGRERREEAREFQRRKA